MSDDMASLHTAKKELRRQIRQTLSHVSEHSVQTQSQAASETLLSLPEYLSAKRISVYLSMPKGELSTRSIVAEALRNGKEVYVPYIHKVTPPTNQSPASAMDMVALRSHGDFVGLQPDSWGIPTPSEDSIVHRKCCLIQQHPEHTSAGISGEKSNLELVIMPGVAFDHKLDRLGHGKGYYDRFLSQYQRSLEKASSPENQMPFLVGLALEEQVLPVGQEVPADASDWRLDALIVGTKPVRRR
ncbi:hypothetical protein XPA_006516 [Xanthoria parietina]